MTKKGNCLLSAMVIVLILVASIVSTLCGYDPTGQINNEVSPITTEVGNDLDKLKKTNVCVECDLSGANLGGANLGGADLYATNLYDANLRMANLTGANLRGANLRKANLTEANLTEANLYGSDLHGANFDGVIGADFTGALNVPAKYLKD